MSEQKIPKEMLAAAAEAIAAKIRDTGMSQILAEAALEAAGVPAMAERIAELEADTDRLRWLMADIDGASNVAGDRHSFASNLARERGAEFRPLRRDSLSAPMGHRSFLLCPPLRVSSKGLPAKRFPVSFVF